MDYGNWLANACTAMNLVSGVISIELAARGKFLPAALMILIGMIFDGLDGKIARLFSSHGSEFGKQLDSLCDVVSFGVAPAFLMYRVLKDRLLWAAALVAICFAVCGVMRLARFNVSPGTPGKGFTGMPITGAGGMLAVVSLRPKLLTPIGLLIFALLLAYLMVSTWRYPDFKLVHLPRDKRILFGLGILVGILLSFLVRSNRLEWGILPLLIYTASGPFYTYHLKKLEEQS